MKTAANIKTFEDVEQIQSENDSRFDRLSKASEDHSISMEELKVLVAQTSEAVAELDKKSKEAFEVLAEHGRRMDERDRQWKEQTAERDRQWDRRMKEADERMKAMDERMEKSWRKMELDTARLKHQVDRVDRQLGINSNNEGEFFEHMARPSIARIAEERFGARFMGRCEHRWSESRPVNLELGAWAVRRCEPEPEVFIFEVKRRFSGDCVKQVRRHRADQVLRRGVQLRERAAVVPARLCDRAGGEPQDGAAEVLCGAAQRRGEPHGQLNRG